ncbi:hypothetical protein Aduo_012514 [Ancylostoma duodenale]
MLCCLGKTAYFLYVLISTITPTFHANQSRNGKSKAKEMNGYWCRIDNTAEQRRMAGLGFPLEWGIVRGGATGRRRLVQSKATALASPTDSCREIVSELRSHREKVNRPETSPQRRSSRRWAFSG